MTSPGRSNPSSVRQLAAPALVISAIPAWLVGLDQGVWLLVAGAAAWNADPKRLPWRFLVPALGFVGLVAMAGALYAPESRWLVLGREVLIAGGFVGVAAAVASRCVEASDRLVFALSVAIVTSSALSLAAFLIQEPFQYQTPIATLVPSEIAQTGLGRLTFVERALAEPSYFLGQPFLRPRGVFLFSTSQAVAQATWIPVLGYLALTRQHRRLWWLVAVGLVLAALLVSTTRLPVFALATALAISGVAVAMSAGRLQVSIPFTPRWVGIYLGVAAVSITIAMSTGFADPILRLATTRSLEGRADLYRWTFHVWQERPLLGWGSEVDPFPTPTPEPTARPSPTPKPTPTPTASPAPVPTPVAPEDRPPLGSHSQYLGVLFKEGIIGLLTFLVVVGVVLAAAIKILRSRAPEALLVAAVLTTLGAAATESIWLDPATAVFVSASWGVVLSAASWTRARPTPDSSSAILPNPAHEMASVEQDRWL